MDGIELKPGSGHITKQFWRKNKYTNKQEHFDPHQIFLSPSIKYASGNEYAPWFKYGKVDIKFVFQVRIKPGSYKIGQQTVGAKRQIDKSFNNIELEWYTKQNIGILITGLLMKIENMKEVQDINDDKLIKKISSASNELNC